MNTSILKVCFKYTSEFKDRYISLESLLQAYFWVSKINTSILRVYFKYSSKIEKKYIYLENLLPVYFQVLLTGSVFNPLMLVVAKGHTYIFKQTWKSWLKLCLTCMIEKERAIEHTNLLIYLGEINCFLFWNGVLHTTVNKGQVEKTRFGHGRTSDWCYRNFLKTMNYLNMVLYNNERFPFNPLMQVKKFSLFQSKFSL